MQADVKVTHKDTPMHLEFHTQVSTCMPAVHLMTTGRSCIMHNQASDFR